MIFKILCRKKIFDILKVQQQESKYVLKRHDSKKNED